MGRRLRVLLVDDNLYDRELVARSILRGFPSVDIVEAASRSELDTALSDFRFDIVITDYHLNWTDGIAILSAVKDVSHDCPVIMYTGTGSEEIAVEAMKLGLDDYIIKSVKHLVRLESTVRSAIERVKVKQRAETLTQQLEAERSRSRLLFDKSADGICILSSDYAVLEANSAFASMIGADDIDSVKGMYPWQWDEICSSPERFHERWPGERLQSETFQTRFRRRDGTSLDVEITATPAHENNQAILFYVCRDVTLRARMLEALRRSQSHLQAAQSQAGIGSWECDADGKPIVWSEEMFKLFDKSSENGVPSTDQILATVEPADLKVYQLDQDRGAVLRRKLAEARRRQPDTDTFSYGYRLRLPDCVRDVEETVRVEEDVDGNPVRWMGTTQDVTERVSAEVALRNSRERLRRALDNIPDVVTVYDPELRIQFINEATTRVTGNPPESYIGKRDDELWPPAVYEAYLPVLRRALETKSKTAVEVKIQLPDTGLRYLLIQCVPVLDHEGGVLEVIGITRDLTDQTELQKQYLHAQRMECVGRLAGGVAHDFNNLLSVVLTYVQLARLKPAGAELQKELDHIEYAGERAAILTRQLLMFSRQETSAPVSLNLDEVITQFEGMLRQVVSERIELLVSLNAPNQQVMADPVQIEQVLMNLVVNAGDAMPDGGRLEISTTRTDEAVRITVSDTGVGMDEQTMEQVFDPFFTTKGVGKGTGLGLSTVYGIVHGLDGKLQVSSRPGNGTTFTIELPITSAPVEALAPRQPVRRIDSTESILIVEDDENLRRATRKLLESSGFKVLSAENCNDAIELIGGGKHAIDLVFTDAVMPGKSGWDLAEYIGKHHPEIKVLCTSGYLDEEHREKRSRLEARHFLPKPYSMMQLTTRIRSLLEDSGDSHGSTPG